MPAIGQPRESYTRFVPGKLRTGATMAISADTSLPRLDDDAIFRMLVEGTATATGRQFFHSLVDNLCRALDTHGAWVAEYVPERDELRAIVMRMGQHVYEDYPYRVKGTPCEQAMQEDRQVHIPDRVVELYPLESDPRPPDAVSYMGVPLKDPAGTVIGQLAVLDTKPLPPEPRCIAVFRIFAARAAAELARVNAERELREREEQLSLLVDGAMDAILSLDEEFFVILANEAAQKIFGRGAGELRARNVDSLFDPKSAERLRNCARELADNARNVASYQWITGGLAGIAANGEPFPAEASLSRYDAHGHTRYTLILRNVNDRLEAERRIRNLEYETQCLRAELENLRGFDEIIGESQALLRALRDLEQVARTRATVLIVGETGTGKELFARALHLASPRNTGPLIKLNCAAIPRDLIESELFGHEKGAFTGATARREGRFSLADGGTLFLDEVGELPLELQARLLRVLQEGEFEPVGSSKTRRVDVRIVAATNRDLDIAVRNGEFRQDLYYRLNVFPIRVPPLRERGEDIILLAERFTQRFQREMGRELTPLTESGKQRLRSYAWPGNVRELQNVIERAVITAPDGRMNLDRAFPDQAGPSDNEAPAPRASSDTLLTDEDLRRLERDNIVRALERAGWKVAGAKGAAALLGLNPSTLSSRMRALGIERPVQA